MSIDLGWTLSFREHAWTFADVTGQEAADLCVMLGDSWDALSPRSSPVALMAHLAVRTAYAEEIPLDAARALVQATPMAVLLASVGDVSAIPDLQGAGAVPADAS